MFHHILFAQTLTDSIAPFTYLLQECSQANIMTSFFSATSDENFNNFLKQICKQYHVTKETLLILTDSPTISQYALKSEFVCFGFTISNSHLRFPHLPLVIEGFDEIDLAYLQREFAHVLHKPALLCTSKRCEIWEIPLEDVPILYHMMECIPYQLFRREPLGTLEEEIEKQRGYIEHIYPIFAHGIWGIYLKETHTLIGRIGITSSMINNEMEYELEYFIGKNFTRQGYATECVHTLLDYIKELGIASVCVRIHKDNIASFGVLSHCNYPYYEYPSEHSQIRCFYIYLHLTDR